MDNPGYPATPGLADASARLGRSLDAQEARQAADDARRRIEAAAPAMLAALQMALVALDRSGKERGTRHLEAVAVRNAIAAATGER